MTRALPPPPHRFSASVAGDVGGARFEMALRSVAFAEVPKDVRVLRVAFAAHPALWRIAGGSRFRHRELLLLHMFAGFLGEGGRQNVEQLGRYAGRVFRGALSPVYPRLGTDRPGPEPEGEPLGDATGLLTPGWVVLGRLCGGRVDLLLDMLAELAIEALRGTSAEAIVRYFRRLPHLLERARGPL